MAATKGTHSFYLFCLLVVVSLLFLLSGCELETVSPLGTEEPGLTDSFHEFNQIIRSGATRVEIRVIPDTLMASRVRIERPEDLTDRERVRSRVSALDLEGEDGIVTLTLGGIQINFNKTTGFRDLDGNALTVDQFADILRSDLASGIFPGVEARREAVSPPQDPDDPTFIATRIQLRDSGENPEDRLRINISDANLIPNDTSPPDSWIRVLGVSIEIRANEGITRLRIREEEDVDIRSEVQSVDLDERSVLLTDGTITRIVPRTEFHTGGDRLTSLEEMDRALEADLRVESRVKGVIETKSPLTIIAEEVRFRLKD